MTVRSLSVVLALGLLLGACSSTDQAGTDGRVLVFAAASLSDVFTEVAVRFEAINPTVEVDLNLAGSSALREQILQGAPADVYASANLANMVAVQEKDELAGPPAIFATNRLQIVVPASADNRVAGLEDFSNPDLLLGLCAEGVPCGDLARRALVAASVDPAIDTNEPDVRALLTKVEADELDAGIVYATDVLSAADDDVRGIEIPEAANVVAEYPIARLADAQHPAAANRFIQFVLGDEGQSILRDHGFGP